MLTVLTPRWRLEKPVLTRRFVIRRDRSVRALYTASAAYVTIGLGLLLQPDRFSRTPSYANLVAIMSAELWGVLYLVTAVLLIISALKAWVAWFGVFAHTASIALCASWLLAFIVRWFTDSGTTVVNITMWGVLLSLLIHSAVDMDEGRPAAPPDRHVLS